MVLHCGFRLCCFARVLQVVEPYQQLVSVAMVTTAFLFS